MNEVVGSAFVEIHAVPSPTLSAETAAIAERTALQIQSKLTPGFQKASKSINGAALGIVAGVALIGNKAVESFSDTIEALNVVDVAFKSNAAGVKKWATGLSSSFGLTNRQILSTSSNFALLLENAQVGLEAATELSKAMTQRAGDLSSFFNISGSQTIDKLTSGLVGESRAVRDLGIDVSETAVAQKAFELGIKGVNGELSQGTKVQIRAQLILEQSTKAAGDAIRTASTFEGRLRTLRGEVGDLSDKIGHDLLPSLGVIGIGAEQTVRTLNEMPGPLRAIGVNLAAAGAAAVAAAFAWQKLGPAVMSVRNALGVASSAVKLGGSLLLDLGATALLGPVGAVAGLVALGAATAKPIAGIKELSAVVGDSDKLLDEFFNKASKEHGPGIFDTARSFLPGAKTKDRIKESADEMRRTIGDVFSKNPELARRIVEAAEKDSSAFGKTYAKGLREELNRLQPKIPKIEIPIMFDFAETAAKSLKDAVAGLDTMTSVNKSVADAQARAKDAAKNVTAIQAQALDFPKKLQAANAELATAHDKVTAATAHLNDLERQRAVALADTASDVRELADAEAALYRGRRRIQDLDESREATLRELAELQTQGPASLAEADRAILRAKISLNTATREETELLVELSKVQEKATEQQAATVDLSGLSVAQIKTKLAGIRAELAAQRTIKKVTQVVTETEKTAQEIEDERLTAKLNVVDAEEALKVATRQRTELEYNQGIRQRELEQTLSDLAVDREDSLRRQSESQTALNLLRDGETTRATTIKTLDGEIKQAKEDQVTAISGVHTAEDGVKLVEIDRKKLNEDIRDAKLAQRDAENEVKTALLERRDAVAQILGDERSINTLLLERIKALPAKTEMEQSIQKQLLAGSIPTLLRGANMIDRTTGKPIAGPPLITQPMIDDIVSRLLRTSGSDILGALRAILRTAGLSVPGLAHGGVIEGVNNSFGQLIRVAEFGHREAILPLQNGPALQRLLQMPTVLNPVLNALPRIALPTLQTQPNHQPNAITAATRRGGATLQLRAERRAEQRELAGYLAEALQEAGLTGGTNDGAITVNIQPPPGNQLSERQWRRAIRDAVEEARRR